MSNQYQVPCCAENVETVTNFEVDALKCKSSKKRWIILLLYNLFCFANTAQWVQYTIIENVVMRFYNVSALAIEWTAIIFSVSSVIFLVPACYFMDRAGLRKSVLFGIIGTTVGAWIKVAAVSPDKIILVYIGQFFISICQIPVATMPTRVSAYWFGEKEIGLASSLCCVGSPIGIAVLLYLAPMLVKNHENIEDVGYDLSQFCLGIAIYSTAVCILIILFFKDQPKKPPSKARALRKFNHSALDNPTRSLARLIKNKNLFFLLVTYGINVGVLNTISNMLNPIYLEQFENGEMEAGRIGLTYFVVGTLCTFPCGMILDKTKAYKKIMVIIYFFSLIGQISFTCTLFLKIQWAVYLSATILGTFSMLCFVIGYEICAEITYPEPEETAASLLNASNHFFTIINIPLMNKLIESYNGIAANISLIVFLIIGLLLLPFMKDEKRRQAAGNNSYELALVKA